MWVVFCNKLSWFVSDDKYFFLQKTGEKKPTWVERLQQQTQEKKKSLKKDTGDPEENKKNIRKKSAGSKREKSGKKKNNEIKKNESESSMLKIEFQSNEMLKIVKRTFFSILMLLSYCIPHTRCYFSSKFTYAWEIFFLEIFCSINS